MICLTFFCKWVFRFAQESKKFHQIIETLNKIVDLVEKKLHEIYLEALESDTYVVIIQFHNTFSLHSYERFIFSSS